MITDSIVIMIPYPEQGIDASGLISNFCPVVSETQKDQQYFWLPFIGITFDYNIYLNFSLKIEYFA
jgi:hypothetical protein